MTGTIRNYSSMGQHTYVLQCASSELDTMGIIRWVGYNEDDSLRIVETIRPKDQKVLGTKFYT